MNSPEPGFILTSQQKETPEGTCLEFWLISDRGPVCLHTAVQPAVFFVEQRCLQDASALLQQAGISHQSKKLTLQTFAHKQVAGLYFSKVTNSYRARDLLKQHSIVCFEEDVRLVDRYLMERFAYACVSFQGQVSNAADYLLLQQGQLKSGQYTPTFRVLSMDIECSEQGQLYSIGLVSEQQHWVIMIGKPEPGPDWILWVEDERALLLAFVDLVKGFDPDIFIGWSLVNFDFRLLIKRAEKLDIPLHIGRANEAISWRKARIEGKAGYVNMPGRLAVDGIEALKTATYQFDSFSLENVAQTLLGKGKLSENVDDRLAQIVHDFHHNKIKLAEYNLQDCRLVLEIFAHTRLLDFLTLRSQLTGLSMDRPGGSVAAFINLYLPKLHRAGYVSPNRPKDGGLASPGGYVMDSRPGLYQHVLVLDFKSLYPSIIRTFKIDPLGLVEGLNHPQDAIPGFKGACFSRHKHFLPDIITSLWQQRDHAKQAQDAARSQAIKILMNSFYGVLGSGGCPFYDTRLASSITLRGHQIMQTTAKWVTEQGYQVIYGDTDSTFVWLESCESTEQAQETGRALQIEINRKWQDKIEQEFKLISYLEIEFETHFAHFLMPRIRDSELGSKKRYAGMKTTAQGTRLIFKGLETVRSDWTELAKNFQTRLYQMVFDGQDVEFYIRQTISQLRAGKLDKQLVYRKRLRRKLDKYVKTVPPHVKAARLADRKNEMLGKSLKYQNKGWVSYLITVRGPEPLEYQTSPLDYEHYIDRQIRPVAEGILPFIGKDFDQIGNRQLALF